MRPEDIITAKTRALKPGQKFRFHCMQCGDCCRHREDILLTPFDLFRIAGHLSITPGEVAKQFQGNVQKTLDLLQDIHIKCVAPVGGGTQ